MLKHLSVNNYVLINDLHIDFESGMTAITGETGAGKSILLGALGFVLGERTDSTVLLDKEKKCVVEARFEFENNSLKPFFEKNDLDYDNVCIVRRELNSQRKSRAFINDTPVQLSLLKEIGAMLIDIHSQHDSLLLVAPQFQLNLLDEMSGNAALLSEYSSMFTDYQECKRNVAHMKQMSEQGRNELDFLHFQLDEFDKADLKEDEYEEVRNRLNKIENSGQIIALLQSSNMLIQNDEKSVLTAMSELNSLMNKLKKFVPDADELQQRIESTRVELKDIAYELEKMEDEMQFDERELASTQERMDTINRLMHKHHTDDYSRLLEIREEVRGKVASFSGMDDEIVKEERRLSRIEGNLKSIADKLHANRLKTIPSFEEKVTSIVHQLAMPHGVFKVMCGTTDGFNESGTDFVKFLFSANLGVEADDISHVSGGELSRLMLAIKRVVANCNYIPTLIFDEIDTGVSGGVASKVANIMKQMSETLQIITITHLPQIASMASEQMLVYKEDDEKSSQTRIKSLSHSERVAEIAKMLSNDSVSDEALEAAKVLLDN